MACEHVHPLMQLYPDQQLDVKKIVMHLFIFGWLCLRVIYRTSRILVLYHSRYSRLISFNLLATRGVSF